MRKIILALFLTFTLLTAFAQPQIVAHRGAWKNTNVPQNSIAALKHAIEQKVWGSEFDVSLTKDDVLIVNHDNTYQGLDVATNTYKTLRKKRLSNGEKLPTAKKYMRTGLKQKHRFLCNFSLT